MLARFLFKGCGQASRAFLNGGLAFTQVAIVWYGGLPTPPPENPPPALTQAVVVERVAIPHPVVPSTGRPQVFYNQQRNFHQTLHPRGTNPNRAEEELFGPVLEMEPFLHRALVTEYDINNPYAHLLAEIFNNPYGLNWMAIMVRLGINLHDLVQGYDGLHEGYEVVRFLRQIPITYIELLVYLGHYDLAALFLEIPVSASSSLGDDIYDPILDSTSFYTLLAFLQEAIEEDARAVAQGFGRLMLGALMSDTVASYLPIHEDERAQLMKAKRAFICGLLQSPNCNLLSYPDILIDCLLYAVEMPKPDINTFLEILSILPHLPDGGGDFLRKNSELIYNAVLQDLSELENIKVIHHDTLWSFMNMIYPSEPLASEYARVRMRSVLNNEEGMSNIILTQYGSLGNYYQALLKEYYTNGLDNESPDEVKKA